MRIDVYTKPACTQCAATRRRLLRAGVPYTEHALADHPDVVDAAQARGITSAPVVVVSGRADGDEDAWWGGFHPDRLDEVAHAMHDELAAAYLAADRAASVELLQDHR